MNKEKKLFLGIIIAIVLVVSIFMLFLPKILGTEGLRGDGLPEALQGVGSVILQITILLLIIVFFRWLARTNNYVKRGMIVGAVLAIPFFSGLVILELGVYTNHDGICPYQEVEDQMAGGSKTICENILERGIPEGEIITGRTCVDGIYYDTNYRCITKTLGFFESEGAMIIVWIFLAEFYSILLGAFMGWSVKKIKRKEK